MTNQRQIIKYLNNQVEKRGYEMVLENGMNYLAFYSPLKFTAEEYFWGYIKWWKKYPRKNKPMLNVELLRAMYLGG
jgi:hypothetical protein